MLFSVGGIHQTDMSANVEIQCVHVGEALIHYEAVILYTHILFADVETLREGLKPYSLRLGRNGEAPAFTESSCLDNGNVTCRR